MKRAPSNHFKPLSLKKLNLYSGIQRFLVQKLPSENYQGSAKVSDHENYFRDPYHFILFQMGLKLVASLVFMGSVALLLPCTNIFRDDPIPADQIPNDCWSLFINNLKVAFLLCQKYSRVRKKFRVIMISFNILRLATRNRYF